MSAPDRNRLDDLFDALGDSHRRRLLVALLQHNPQADTGSSADGLLSEEPSDALELQLYHTHLPKLEERGYVEWDREAHTVSVGPAFDEVRPVLELLDEHSDELPVAWP